MAAPKEKVSAETVEFHEIVQRGSLAELQTALANGAAVNAPGHLGMTALMVAIRARDLEKMKLLIQQGADPEQADTVNHTALRWAVHADFAAGVSYLLSLGVDRGYHPKYPLKKMGSGFALPEVKVPAELKDFVSEADWKESLQGLESLARESLEHPGVEPMIGDVQSVEVLKLFLEAGDDLSLAPNEIKRAHAGLGQGGKFKSSLKDYRKHKSPRFGTRNPERMDNPFWRDMVRLGGNAYSARRHFQDTTAFSKPGAVWCFDRSGSSLTPLPDGRFVQIGGEHEDFYDPDFHIYNDVVIHDGRGDFQIYGYPRKVFPPTDSHTATLAGDWIYIIGCVGHPKQRRLGHTPVYRLQLDTWAIEAVEASGDTPSWLHEHRARYVPERHVIRVEGGSVGVLDADGDLEPLPNPHRFELDLSSFQWRKLK